MKAIYCPIYFYFYRFYSFLVTKKYNQTVTYLSLLDFLFSSPGVFAASLSSSWRCPVEWWWQIFRYSQNCWISSPRCVNKILIIKFTGTLAQLFSWYIHFDINICSHWLPNWEYTPDILWKYYNVCLIFNMFYTFSLTWDVHQVYDVQIFLRK